jgi:hypothetical protein
MENVVSEGLEGVVATKFVGFWGGVTTKFEEMGNAGMLELKHEAGCPARIFFLDRCGGCSDGESKS